MRIYLTFLFKFLLLIVTAGWSQTLIWEPTSGPVGGDIKALAINDSGHIFAGSWVLDGQIFRSKDNGDNWEQVTVWGGGKSVWSLVINDSGHIFAGINSATGEGVYRSVDNGDTWQASGSGITNTSVNDLAISGNGSIFAATDYGVFRSSDNGDTWIEVNNGLPAQDIFAYAIIVNHNGYIFAGTAFDGVFRSTDTGDSWEEKNNGLLNPNVYSLMVNDSGYVFVGPESGRGIHRSTDQGETWLYFDQGFPLTMYGKVDLTINSNGFIFAGSEYDKVFRSTDNGETWMEFGTGLTNPHIWSLAVNTQNYLFAGSAGDGVFRTTQPTTFIEYETGKLPQNFYLEQNYPNPFNPYTTIAFSLRQASNIKMTIYSVTGEKVSELIDGYAEMGYHTVKWNGRDQNGHPVSTGIYLYELVAGSHRKVGKMFLVR